MYDSTTNPGTNPISNSTTNSISYSTTNSSSNTTTNSRMWISKCNKFVSNPGHTSARDRNDGVYNSRRE